MIFDRANLFPLCPEALWQQADEIPLKLLVKSEENEEIQRVLGQEKKVEYKDGDHVDVVSGIVQKDLG
jgi:hypothetical protein